MSDEILVISTFVCRHPSSLLTHLLGEWSITVAANILLMIRVLSVGTEITSVVDGIQTLCWDSDVPHSLAEIDFH